jgi:hypothetical protein
MKLGFMKLGTSAAAIGVALSAGAAAYAHHSAAAFDTAQNVEISGTVVEYAFKNPHVYFTLEVTREDGSTFEQEIEAGAGSVLLALGLTETSLTVGEHVVVTGNPNRRGEGRVALGREVIKDDGTVLPLNIASRSALPPVDASTDTLAGTWFPPFASFGAMSGSRRNWKLTEAAQEAVASFDSVAEGTHAACVPVGAPMLMAYPVANVITVEEDTVTFDIDWMTSKRVVHLDMAEHPADLEPTLHGHSIGRWEGETLVVDTIGFTPHREGLGFGLPSSEGKHLVERFSVSEDGKHLIYDVTIEDPAYLVEPATAGAQLDYRPDLMLSGEECDLEVAQRYQEEAAQ